MSKASVRALLVSQFKTSHVDNALKYYEAATEKFIARVGSCRSGPGQICRSCLKGDYGIWQYRAYCYRTAI